MSKKKRKHLSTPELVAQVADDSGIDRQTCEKVIASLEKITARAAGEYGPISEAFSQVNAMTEPGSGKQA